MILINTFNKALNNFLKEAVKIRPIYSKDENSKSMGDLYDLQIRKALEKAFNNYDIKSNTIDNEQWQQKTISCKKASLYDFDFTYKDEEKKILNDELDKNQVYIVNKPNNSQKWPDILIIYNNIGLPIEIKSAKNNNIVWNSGYPRKNSIYIFGSSKHQKSTYFLGQDVIKEEEKEKLFNLASQAKIYCQNVSGDWSFYVRKMYTSTLKYFEDDIELTKSKIENKIQNDEENIINFEEELIHLGDKNEIKKKKNKIGSLKKNVNNLKTKIQTIEEEAKNKESKNNLLKDKRDFREKNCEGFVKGLSWDNTQQSNFQEKNPLENEENNTLEESLDD